MAVAELVRELPRVPDEVRDPERAGIPRTAVGVDVVGSVTFPAVLFGRQAASSAGPQGYSHPSSPCAMYNHS